MKIELLQAMEINLKSKKIDVIDILSLVETYLQDDYEADYIQFARLKDSMFSIDSIIENIENEYTNK